MLTITLLTALLSLTPLTHSLPSAQRAELEMLKAGPCEFTEPANDKTKEVYKHQQVTPTNNCLKEESCSTTEVTQYTFSYEVVGGANSPFTSAGFGVSESWSNGDNMECSGSAGGSVCTWMKVKYLEYEAKATGYCDPDVIGTTRTFRAPVTGEGKDTQYYCVNGKACRQNSDFYWE